MSRRTIAVSIVAAFAVLAASLAGLVMVAAFLLAGTIASTESTAYCLADASSTTGNPDAQPIVTAITAAATTANAGINTAAVTIAAAVAASNLTPTPAATARTSDQAGVLGLSRQAFPETRARDWGTARDRRLDTRASAAYVIDALMNVLRTGGTSAHETPDAIAAALASLGIDSAQPGRWWARWKQADLTGILGAPGTPSAVATLVNAAIGFASGGVAANAGSPQMQAYGQRWTAIAQLLGPVLLARAQAAAEGDTTFVVGDSVVRTIDDDLVDAGMATAVADRRRASAVVLSGILTTTRAQSARAWVIALGTYNPAADAGQVPAWLDAVDAARTTTMQEVYWVAPWRPDRIANPEPAPVPGSPDDGGTWTATIPNPLGSSAPIAAALRAGTQSRPWLHVLSWDQAVTDKQRAWFDADATPATGALPNMAGAGALLTLITAVAMPVPAPDDVFGPCSGDLDPVGDVATWEVTASSATHPVQVPAGATSADLPLLPLGVPTAFTISGYASNQTLVQRAVTRPITPRVGMRDVGVPLRDTAADGEDDQSIHAVTVTVTTSAVTVAWAPPQATGALVLDGPSGRFVDAAPLSGSDRWLPQVQLNARKALIRPPCEDNPSGSAFGCESYCAQLAARINGQSSGFYRVAGERWAYTMFLSIRDATTVDRGLIGSGREFTPPPGALLFWYMGPDHPGHVAVYIGGGQIVTNYTDRRVVQMPAQRLVDEYAGYLGWLAPPPSWTRG